MHRMQKVKGNIEHCRLCSLTDEMIRGAVFTTRMAMSIPSRLPKHLFLEARSLTRNHHLMEAMTHPHKSRKSQSQAVQATLCRLHILSSKNKARMLANLRHSLSSSSPWRTIHRTRTALHRQRASRHRNIRTCRTNNIIMWTHTSSSTPSLKQMTRFITERAATHILHRRDHQCIHFHRWSRSRTKYST